MPATIECTLKDIHPQSVLSKVLLSNTVHTFYSDEPHMVGQHSQETFALAVNRNQNTENIRSIFLKFNTDQMIIILLDFISIYINMICCMSWKILS